MAIFLHELPQEVSDYALLRRAGLSRLAAVGLNVGCSLAALAGTGTALAAGAAGADAARGVLLPLAAGGLLYLGVGVMLPELVALGGGERMARPRGRFCSGGGGGRVLGRGGGALRGGGWQGRACPAARRFCPGLYSTEGSYIVTIAWNSRPTRFALPIDIYRFTSFILPRPWRRNKSPFCCLHGEKRSR